MSWNKTAKGNKQAILDVLRDKPFESDGHSSIQKAQLQAAKDLITAEVSAMQEPPEGSAIQLSSYGHADEHVRNLFIQITTVPA